MKDERTGLDATTDASLEARAKAMRRAFNEAQQGHEWGDIAPWIAALTSADASRPPLTEEQAMLARIVDALATNQGTLTGHLANLCALGEEAAALLRASRGETGPAPPWGEQAIAEHRRAAEPEPFEKIEQLPTLGPGISGAPIRVRPTAADDPSPAEEKHTTRTLAWHVRPDAIRVSDEHGRVIASTYPESQEADSHWLVWWQRQPTRQKDHAAPHHRLSKSSALHAIREGLAWWGCDVSRLDMPPPDPRATLHAGDPASLTARLTSARAEHARLDERFRSYDGGDRAPSPPASLLREERAAAQRVRDIEAEIAASKEPSR